MCVVSMVMDHYYDRWKQSPQYIPSTLQQLSYPSIPQTDIDEFYKLLKRAREYDARNNEPNCELQEKKDKLLKLAKELGISINFEENT